MIKRYFFIASVPHESESGEWMMADEVNDEINRLRAALWEIHEYPIEDRAREKHEWQQLIEKAADFIGCEDKSMWSTGVVEAALHHANFTRREWESCLKIIREKDYEIEALKKDLELNASMLARQCDLAREAETGSMMAIHGREAMERLLSVYREKLTEKEAEIDAYQNTIGDLTEHMDRQDAKIKRLRDAIRKIEEHPDEAYEVAEKILRETT